PPRVLPPEILRSDAQAFAFEIARHELAILCPDEIARVGDVAAAEHLDLQRVPRAARFEQFVDQLFHGEVAVARRLGVAAPALRPALREHEVIHAADARAWITNAGGHA